ncbi:MAG: albE [Bacillales bacterium]|jgi:predicted Zn-dependent peptidase|nr:albE [Bacillales bacterium]
MKNIDEKIYKYNRLKLHVISTKKFKTITVLLRCKSVLDKESVTERALLPFVLQSGTKDYDNPIKLRTYLDDLFGARLSVDVTKKGSFHVLSFRVDVVNDKFLPNKENLLSRACKILADILLNPVKENDAFKNEFVETEKRILAQKLDAIFDDKMQYASQRITEEMFENDDYKYNSLGISEKISKIDSKSLYNIYENVIENDDIDIYILGDVVKEEVIKNVEQSFGTFLNRTHDIKQFENKSRSKRDELKEVKEEQDISQGKLNIGYFTNITYKDEDYFALQMFNGIFGGFSHSKLFINVREKNSLAYFANSRIESHKGIMLVMTGIEASKYKQAVEIIDEQLEEMKKGNITDKEIDQTKLVLINQILETLDTPRGLLEIYYHNVVSNKVRKIDEWIDKLSTVTKEQIVEVANKIEKDTIYFLSGKEAN